MPFCDLAGHRRLFELLSRAIACNSLPGALVFSGPDGVGKRETALAVAQAFNCTRLLEPASCGLPLDACGKCPACSRVARGIHPDVVLLAPGDTGSIKIDAVRRAIDHAAYRPFEGRRRVVIVDQAEALGTDAQDALLKSLEEPPAASLFILVTARPETLLPTVRSRCQNLRFGVLSAGEITSILVEDYGHPEERARAAAAIANGSLGQALAVVDSDLVEVREAAWRVLEGGSVKEPRVRLDMIRGLSRKRPASATTGNERDDLAVHLRALASLLRDVALVSSRGQRPALANADLGAGLEKAARSFGGGRALRAFAAVDQALDALERNANPKVVVDWLAFHV